MGSSINALIARGLPAIDPASDYAKLSDLALEAQQKRLDIQQQQQLLPVKLQAAQQLAQENALKLRETQADAQDQKTIQEYAANPVYGGDMNKVVTGLIGHIRPKAYYALRADAIKENTDRINQAKSTEDVKKIHAENFSNMAYGALQNGSIHAFGGTLTHAVQDGSMTPAEADAIAQENAQAPDPVAHAKTYLLGKLTPADREKYDTSQEKGQKLETEKSAADRAQAVDESYGLQNDADVAAWKKRHSRYATIIGDTFKPDTPGVIRLRLGVPVKDQPTYEEKQSEVDWLNDPDRLPKLKAQIDSVIPPSKGPIYAYENNMATQAVANARNQKDAQAAVKDSADRIGRFESGVASAKATAPIKIEVAQGEAAARQAANASSAKPIEAGSPDFRVAQDLAYGRLAFPQFRTLFAYGKDVGKKLAVYQKASELNPNFNPAAFEMGFKFASNPKTQAQLASLDNVVRGVPDLLEISDKASRTGVPLINKYIIPGGIALGGKKYSDFNTAQTAFADELSGALGYGSATDMSREMGFNMTDKSLSPDAFRSAIQTVIIPFIDRKRASMLNQMGVYGQPGMNPAAAAPTATPAGTAPVEKWERGPDGKLRKVTK